METISRINTAEAKKLLGKNGKAKIIDVRTKGEYDQQHIQGSEHFAMEDITASGVPYPKETPLLIACNRGLMKSEISAQRLSEKGYSNVYILNGGLQAWFSDESQPVANKEEFKC